MGSTNFCLFTGHVSKDPELKMTPGGKAMVTFSIAVTETWKDASGAKKEKTEWINCKMFGTRAEILAKYVKARDYIIVKTKYSTNKGNDGKTYTSFMIEDFTLVGALAKKGDSSPAPSHEPDPFDEPGGPGPGEDIPF